MNASQHLMPSALQGNDSIYYAMSRLANTFGAVDLAQGLSQVHIAGTQQIVEHTAKALETGSNSYTDPRGLCALRSALAADAQSRYGVTLDPDEQVTVTAGAQDALGAAMLGLLEPGDEVVFLEPFYNPVVPMARLAGAQLRFVSLLQNSDTLPFALDEQRLWDQMSERTKLIVYSSPNSPSGHVFTYEELMMLARACRHFDAYLIADEVYEHLTYDAYTHVSALQIPELMNRMVVISSISKSYLLSGWRVGWAQGAAPLVAGIRKVHELMSFCLPEFVCEGARFAIAELGLPYIQRLRAIHQQKRDWFCEKLTAIGVRVVPPQGTFFCSIDISAFGATDDLSFSLAMPKDIGVAGVPMSLSWNQRKHGRHLIRLCFSRSDNDLERALAAFAASVPNK